jgi:hypothetical protein
MRRMGFWAAVPTLSVVASSVLVCSNKDAQAWTDAAHASSTPWDSAHSASRSLDSLARVIQDSEERAYAISSMRFFQDPEDAQGARSGFYQSSVKVFRLAVDADSTNAEALYHLGVVLARKSYLGAGTWDRSLLRQAVSALRRAQLRATGPYARLRSLIERDLARENHNLETPR